MGKFLLLNFYMYFPVFYRIYYVLLIGNKYLGDSVYIYIYTVSSGLSDHRLKVPR